MNRLLLILVAVLTLLTFGQAIQLYRQHKEIEDLKRATGIAFQALYEIDVQQQNDINLLKKHYDITHPTF